jgi:FkbH-like protein
MIKEYMNKIQLLFLDLDETLWDGVVSEGDVPILKDIMPNDIEYLLLKGIITCIISNSANEQRALKYLNYFGFNIDKFADVIFTTSPKAIIIKKINERLSVLPDKVAIVDDSESVRVSLNAIGCKSYKSYDEFKRKNDLIKYKDYDLQVAYNRLRIRQESLKIIKIAEFGIVDINLKEYLRSNNFKINVDNVCLSDIKRVADLFYRTNQLQFNKMCFIDMSAMEVELKLYKMIEKGYQISVISIECHMVGLGVVGAILYKKNKNYIRIINACYSCTVIPFKYVEYLSLSVFINKIINQGCFIKITVFLNKKNIRVKWLLDEIGERNIKKYIIIRNKINISEDLYKFIYDKKLCESYDGVYSIGKFYDEHVLEVIFRTDIMLCVDIGYGHGEILGKMRNDEIITVFNSKGGKYQRYDLLPKYPNVLYGDVTQKLNIKDESIDIVICLELLEHVTDPLSAIMEIQRILKKGGYLFMSVPSISYPCHPFDDDISRFSSNFVQDIMSMGFRKQYMEVEGYAESEIRSIVLYKKELSLKLEDLKVLFKRKLVDLRLPGSISCYQ